MGGMPVLERYADAPRNGRAAAQRMSMEMAIAVRPTLLGFELPASGEFDTLTWFEDADGLRLSAGVWTREWAGGRLAVLPFSLDEPGSENAILNQNRKWQIEAVLEWLTGRPLPVKVDGAADLAAVYRESRGRDRIVIGLADFALDDADEFALIVPALAGRKKVGVRMLDNSGRWGTAKKDVGGDGRIELGGALAVPAQEVRLVELRVRRR
jgi:hypothetical protein